METTLKAQDPALLSEFSTALVGHPIDLSKLDPKSVALELEYLNKKSEEIITELEHTLEKLVSENVSFARKRKLEEGDSFNKSKLSKKNNKNNTNNISNNLRGKKTPEAAKKPPSQEILTLAPPKQYYYHNKDVSQGTMPFPIPAVNEVDNEEFPHIKVGQ